ncbi:peptidylprolyl isomerase [Marinobacter alexandrii]|uniref:peptidylprolyl isomerase n=1 Tax=Marinobacter alexandrii TaxID=2570351 RepID=UPI003296DD8B
MSIKQLLRAATMIAAICWLPVSHAATEVLDQVVAIVDDDVIMASELRERLATVTKSMEARGGEMPPEDTLIRDTLDRLILESIQVQIGYRVGVRISDQQLNSSMERIAAQNNMNLEQFRQALEAEGQSYNRMRENVRRELIIQRVQGGNVNQRVQISDQEVDNFLTTEEGMKYTQPEYRMMQALLAVSPDESATEVASKEEYVDRLLARIQAGEGYDVVLSSASRYPFSGGDLGWRSAEDLPSMFSDIAPTLKRGETGKVRSASGFHLVYMGDVRGGSEIVAQTEASHILIKPSEIMTDNQAKELITDIRRRAINGEDFAELAKQYSEDIGSAQEGGSLGWTMRGQMVPEFDNMMDATAVGEISEPFRTQFGYHIIKVEGRRDEDVTDTARRAKAMEYLHGRKYQEELDAWLRKIRDEAFIDIK